LAAFRFGDSWVLALRFHHYPGELACRSQRAEGNAKVGALIYRILGLLGWDMADETYYSVLEISETAQTAEIKEAYLRRSAKFTLTS